MNEKSDKYHIKIPVDFLIGATKEFKSKYTKWVYVFLKLKFNFYIQKKPNTFYKIDVNEIGQLFRINKATVFDCFNELKQYGLLEKNGRGSYKINQEEALLKFEKTTEAFIKIYNNWFMDFCNKGNNTVDADVYFFLTNENRHHLTDEKLKKVSVSQSKICRNLKIDTRTYKRCKEKLLDSNYLFENENVLYTVKQFTGYDKSVIEQSNYIFHPEEINQTIEPTTQNRENAKDKGLEIFKKLTVTDWIPYIDADGKEYAIPYIEVNNLDAGLGWHYGYAVKKENYGKYKVSFNN
jgi:hypothetical protein